MEPVISLGRRKTSVSRVVTLTEGTGEIIVNGRESQEYFPVTMQQFKLQQPFKLTETVGKYDVIRDRVDGGGITGQVEAVRLGIARALVKIDPELKPKLKAEELMTRNPRETSSARSSDARRRVSATSSASVKVPRLFRIQSRLDSSAIPPDPWTPATSGMPVSTGTRKVNPNQDPVQWLVLNSSSCSMPVCTSATCAASGTPTWLPTSSTRRRGSTSST
jgi:small subunit ribosomal protein S9